MSNKIKTVCVYCASREGNNPEFLNSSKKLGKILAESEITLIYGGSIVGLMGTVADSVLENGGKVIGIIPEVIEKQGEIRHQNLTEQHRVGDMHERKKLMADKSDAFIAMPGGFGTMDETFEIITWKVIGLHNKPIVFVNVDGFYDPVIKLINHFVENGVVPEFQKNAFRVVNSVEEALPALEEQLHTHLE